VSRENVELARRGYDALASGDMEAVLAGLDPAIVIRPPGEVMGEELYYGHAGFLRYAGQWLEAWDDYRVIPEEFFDAGDQVVVIYRAVGRGKGSGITTERRNAHLWTVRGGKAVRLEIFAEPDDALRAAGLPE
jgi:uncharacterized protein